MIFGWSSLIGTEIYAKSLPLLADSALIIADLITLDALNSPPYFISILLTEPYAPLPIYLRKM